VGTELLLGDIVNTNAAFLSVKLAELGIHVYRHTVVGDNPTRLSHALDAAFAEADLVITSGGLGPTYDDLTKETVAAYFGKKMIMHEESLATIKAYFERTGRVMTPNNEKQADIPLGAIVLKNRTGTAPGIFIEHNGKVVVLLPGPPFELCPMFEEFVFPRLRKMSDKILISHNIHIMGLGESEVEMHLLDLMKNSVNPSLAPYAKEGEMRLRVGALANSEAEGEAMCQEMIEKVKSSPVGEYIYALDAEYIEKLVVEKLKEKKLTLSSAESCTGGYFGKRITDISGASNVFAGGFITYSNQAKIDLLGVNPKTLEMHSAVSSEVAIEMASGTRERLDTDIAISITGEAGPNPDPATNQPVGTVFIGVATREQTYSIKLTISRQRDREYIRKVASSRAMREIVKQLIEY
jgi:nicotinamide-nucleotide amidase